MVVEFLKNPNHTHNLMNCRCISDILCMHILFLHSYSEEYHLLIRTLSAILVAELKNLNMQLEYIFQNLVTICIIEKSIVMFV